MSKKIVTLISPINLSNFNMPLSPPYSLALLKAYIEEVSPYEVKTFDTRVPFFYRLLNDEKLLERIAQGSFGHLFPEWLKEQQGPQAERYRERLRASFRQIREAGQGDPDYWEGINLLQRHALKFNKGLKRLVSVAMEQEFWTEELKGLFSYLVGLEAMAASSIFGISNLIVSQVPLAIILCRLLKELYPDAMLMIGGSCIRTHFEKEELKKLLLAEPAVDLICHGEGEPTFRKLLEKGEAPSQRVMEEVPGILHRDGTEPALTLAEEFKDLGSLPPPDYSGLPLDHYLHPELILTVGFSRGCYWRRCRFCTNSVRKASYRMKPTDGFVEELALLKERYCTRTFWLLDEVLPLKTFERIAETILSRGLDIRYTAYLRADRRADPTFYDKLFQSGCRLLFFGIESFADHVLLDMDKGTSLEDNLASLKRAAEAGISTGCFHIIGYPAQSDGDLDADIRALFEWHPYISFFISYNFSLDSNTRIFQERFSHIKGKNKLVFNIRGIPIHSVEVPLWDGRKWMKKKKEVKKEFYRLKGAPILEQYFPIMDKYKELMYLYTLWRPDTQDQARGGNLGFRNRNGLA